MVDGLGDAIRENARDLAQLSELPAVNHMNCPRISLPTSICSARGDGESAGPFEMIELEKTMLLTMLSEQTSGVDQGRFPVNRIWKLLF